MSNTMRLGIRILLFLISSIVALISLEFFLARFYPQQTIDAVQSIRFECFEEGKHRWVKLKKNATCTLKSLLNTFPPVDVKTNSMGMRNPEITLQKPNDTKRVLFIGDSFIMGWGLPEEQGVVRMTESFIATYSGIQKTQVINAGFTAAGPSGYYLSLLLDGLPLDPDIVVIGFFLGNDILSRKDVEWTEKDAQGLPTVVRSKSSYIDSTGQLRLKAMPLAYRIPHLRRLHSFIFLMKLLNPTMVIPNQNQLIRDTICIFNPQCHEFDQSKSEVKFLFETMNTILASQGKKLIVALIPTHFQVHFDVGYKIRYNLPVIASERRFLEDEFIAFFRQNAIDYIDLLPPLLDHAGSTRLYFPMDDHWNKDGHAIAAKAITEKLVPFLQ